jgi:sugar phosphate isomerase/epimerase
MDCPVALQMYSVRDRAQEDLRATLGEIRAMGYDGVEFAGLFGCKPATVRRWLDVLGLTPVSAHVPLPDLLAHTQQVLDDYALIGCPYVAVPYLPLENRPGSGRFEETLSGIRAVGEAARSRGMTLLYHNHDFEFEKIGGEFCLDFIYRTIPAEFLQTEIDTCWVHVTGVEPAGYLCQYAGRAPVVHLKDFVMPGKKTARMYELIGTGSQAAAEEPSAFEFRHLGAGEQDIPALVAAARFAQAKWLVVEQDRPSLNETPLQSAAASLATLKAL